MIKNAIAIVRTLDSMLNKKSDLPVDMYQAIVNNLSDVVSMSSYANRELIMRRSELIKPHIKEQ